MSRQSIAEQLNTAQVALDNARSHQEILTLLSEYLVDLERINEGIEHLLAAQSLHEAQEREYGQQYTATDELNQAWDKAEAVYNRHVALARVALKKHRGARAGLALDGDRKRTLSGWLEQSQLFYKNALADAAIVTRLGKVGLTEAKLQAGWDLVKAVEAANAGQEQEKGEAQQATVERDQALDQLNDWMADFAAIAQVALADHPQLLESLGLGPVAS